MGLTPKPVHKEPTETWEDLDRYLHIIFGSGSKSNEASVAFINPDRYVMTTEEILQAGRDNNYQVTLQPDGQIKFE